MVSKKLEQKVQPTILALNRHVEKAHYNLSVEQKEKFKGATVSTVFTTTFLMRNKILLARTEAQLRNSSERAQSALTRIGVITMGQLLEKRYEEIASVPGMGPSAVGLILDVVTLFGFSIAGVSVKAIRNEANVEGKAEELSLALGI